MPAMGHGLFLLSADPARRQSPAAGIFFLGGIRLDITPAAL
jgi:hypothetical protein